MTLLPSPERKYFVGFRMVFKCFRLDAARFAHDIDATGEFR
ncbi:hypothetical protein ACLJYM_12795 [Rhizobium giardinii]